MLDAIVPLNSMLASNFMDLMNTYSGKVADEEASMLSSLLYNINSNPRILATVAAEANSSQDFLQNTFQNYFNEDVHKEDGDNQTPYLESIRKIYESSLSQLKSQFDQDWVKGMWKRENPGREPDQSQLEEMLVHLSSENAHALIRTVKFLQRKDQD
jgi:hypothetical protein